MAIQIRATQERDYGEIERLLRFNDMGASYFTKERFERMLKKNRGLCYVAEDDGPIVGSVFAYHDGGLIGSVRKLAVAANYRRKGIGSQLVSTAVDKLCAAGIPLIYAHVEKTNEASMKLLKKFGFSVRGTHYLIDRGKTR